MRGLAIALIACGSSPPEPPKPRELTKLASYPGATLVASGRRVAIATADGWYELTASGPQAVPAIASELAKLRGELGELELFLGAQPIAVGGEEHHEQYVQLAPAPRRIELDGHLVRVVATGGAEVWQFEEKLRAQLAVVHDGAVLELPAHHNVAEPVDSPSPVSAKRCAAPAIADLAVTGDVIAAVLVECNPRAPIRIATYRWPGPRVEVAKSLLAVQSPQLAGRTLAGIAGGTLVLDGKPTAIAASLVLEAVAAADGAIWTLTTTEHDQRTIARDGIAQPIAKPAQLALDDDRGVTVLAADGTLYVER